MTRSRQTKSVFTFAILTALLCSSASMAAPRFDVEKPETWKVPPAREQLSMDSTLVLVAKGAIFVPSMTDGTREPPYLVMADGKVIATTLPGTRTVLEPGVYDVLIGSGSGKEQMKRKVLVKEGLTTRIPADWSGLVVNVMNEYRESFRGTYELISLPSKKTIGVGFGADVEIGEEVRTWIVPPGNYMIIRTGDGTQARRDFLTIRLMPGELHKVTLVMDKNSGDFLGGGELDLGAGLKLTKSRNWQLHMILGGDFEFNRRSDVVGFPSGYGFTLGGFFDFLAQYKPLKHYVYLRLRLEEKQIKMPDQAFMKDKDELKLDALYVYRALPWLGPYIRVGASTALFPGYVDFQDPTAVKLVDKEGVETGDLGTATGRFKLSESGAPTDLKAGVGLGFLVTGVHWFDMNFRVGFGGRMVFTRGLLSPYEYDKTANTYKVRRRDDAYQYGVESTVVASLRLTRWILATTELEFLEPINDYKNPVADWESNVGFRLASFASINYIFKLVKDVSISDHLQTEHRVLLRLSWQIF